MAIPYSALSYSSQFLLQVAKRQNYGDYPGRSTEHTKSKATEKEIKKSLKMSGKWDFSGEFWELARLTILIISVL
jgi:hypothetical protein